jgi:elongation factor G
MGLRQTPAGSLIEVAIEPKAPADQDRLIAALTILTTHDPSLTFSSDAVSGQTIVGGVHEDHLGRAINELRRTSGIQLNIGAPQVAYRERISRAVEIEYTHKWQAGGQGQFARVRLAFAPGEPGSGFVFANTAGDAVRDQFVPGVIAGLEACRLIGVVAGFPLVESKATLVDGAYHEIDSSAATFEIAARAAFRMLKDRDAVELVEPIMVVEVVTPDEFIGGVIGDLNARQGIVQGTHQRDNDEVVTALVRLAFLLGYVNSLLTLTHGRGHVSIRFDHYDPVPRSNDDPSKFPPAAAMRMRA